MQHVDSLGKIYYASIKSNRNLTRVDSKYKYPKRLTSTPPRQKFRIMREYPIEKNRRKKIYSTVSSLFSL